MNKIMVSVFLGGVLLFLLLFLARPPATTAASQPVQETCTPIGNAREMFGQVVTVCARATMYTGGFYAGSGNARFYMQDDTGGVQIQMFDENGVPLPDVTLGDWVTATGVVGEYQNEIQIVPQNNPEDVLVTDGTPADVPPPLVRRLDEIGEETEGWLVQVRGRATRIEEFTYSWEMDLSDGVNSLLIYVDKNTGIDLAGYELGYTYLITGISVQYGDTYEVKPRLQADIRVLPSLLVGKTAPPTVRPGGLLTYTIGVSNYTQITLTNLIVTDRIPITNAALARVLDGGVLMDGGVISWTLPTLVDGAGASFRFVVTATDELGAVISNTRYTAWAAEWITRETGLPVYTIVGDYLPTYLIQGEGTRSPYEGIPVLTVGVVVGFFQGNMPGSGSFDGFFIQDPVGDGITTTSDGLFVNYGTLNVNVQIGDLVTVTGVVQEFSEWDGTDCEGDACQTQLAVSHPADVEVFGTAPFSTTVLAPPGDPEEAALYWESLEGMHVTLPMTGAVVGPTNYGTIQVVSGGEGITRVLRGSPWQGMPVGVRHWERYGAMGGGDPPNLIVGSVVENVDGPLAYSYGSYLVATQAGDEWTVVYQRPAPDPPPSWPAAGPNEFTLLTFNVENFFDTIDDPGKGDPVIDPVEYATHRDKIAAAIGQAGYPTVVGLQEVEKLEVLEDLAAVLAAQGYTYTAVLSEGLDGRGIDVGYLVRDDRVQIEGVAQYQDCTDYDTGLGQGDCPAGQQLLFSRLPLLMTATVELEPQPLRVVFVVNHLKSKHSRSGDPESAQWRFLQAHSLAGKVARIGAAHPELPIILLGDLNDFEDSVPLEEFYTTGGLTNTWYLLPPEARYSYIYRGVSQILDHILVSPAGLVRVQEVGPLHYDADFPYKPYHDDPNVVWRASDHDPVAVTFGLPTAPYLGSSSKAAPAITATLHTSLVYTVTLQNTGLTATVTITDTLPAGLDLVQGFDGGGLVWSGTVGMQESRVLTLVARVGGDASSFISPNLVLLNDGVNPLLTLESGIVPVRLSRVYLPLAVKW